MNIFSLTCEEIAAEMKRRYGKGHYHAAALYREVFKKGNPDFAAAPEFLRSPDLAEKLAGFRDAPISATSHQSLLLIVCQLGPPLKIFVHPIR